MDDCETDGIGVSGITAMDIPDSGGEILELHWDYTVKNHEGDYRGSESLTTCTSNEITGSKFTMMNCTSHTMDTVDGLYCVTHYTSCDVVDTGHIIPRKVQPSAGKIPQRSELRVRHAQQDQPDGDQLGGALVTYKHEQGDNIHRFEEFGLFEKSLLRDYLHVTQNDQLVTLNEWTVNEMDHNAVVKLFLNLAIGQEHEMVVANHAISTDTLRKMSFSLYGFTTEEPDKEEKPVEMLRVENYTLAAMSMSEPGEHEVTISLVTESHTQHLYLNKYLSFVTTRSTDTDTSVHFIRQRSRKFDSNFDAINTTTFKHKDKGFLAIDGNGNVVYLPHDHPDAKFKATYNDWSTWYIKSHWHGRYLAEKNGKLCSTSIDRDGRFKIEGSSCRDCF